MVPAEALRNKILDRLPEQLRLRVAKQLRRARVRATNHPFGIRDKNRVRRNIKQILQRGVSELGPFVLGRSRCVLFRGIRRAHDLASTFLERYPVSRCTSRNSRSNRASDPAQASQRQFPAPSARPRESKAAQEKLPQCLRKLHSSPAETAASASRPHSI